MIKPAHTLLEEERQFYQLGYEIFNSDYNLWKIDIRDCFQDYLFNQLKTNDIAFNINDIKNYHQIFNANQIQHHQFIKRISRVIPNNYLSPNCRYINLIKEKASELFKSKVEIFKNKIEFRVVRPNCADNNLFHRDHWFPYFKPLINIYLPICGSDYRSVLKIVPGSHHWPDEDVKPTFEFNSGKTRSKDGILYSTPTILECKRNLEIHKPDVKEGDFMFFSPMIIHGGGENHGSFTRFSLEIRLQLMN